MNAIPDANRILATGACGWGCGGGVDGGEVGWGGGGRGVKGGGGVGVGGQKAKNEKKAPWTPEVPRALPCNRGCRHVGVSDEVL